MSDEQVLFAAAVLGKDAEEFMSSDLGRVLLGNAEQEAAEALEELASADATDSKLMMRLQAKVWRARSFSGWLSELVINGQQALSVLDSRDRDD